MRYQFIDKIKRVEIGKEIITIKCVSSLEDYFEHHFIGFPVMPGALQIEAMAQACGALIEISSDYQLFSILLMVEKIKFKRMVHPGDKLFITATVVSQHEESALFDVKVVVDDKIVTSGTLMTGIVSEKNVGGNFSKAINSLRDYFAFLLRDTEIIR